LQIKIALLIFIMFDRIIIITLFCFFIFSISCSNDKNQKEKEIGADLVHNPISASGKSNTDILPKFKFSETNHDFGVIIQGEKVSYTYTFKNVGGSDLIITSASASCGCTVAHYDKNPIPPGKDGKIEIIFDSNGKTGMQHKAVSVMANTQPNQISLDFTAEIVVP
jgi:hypothetical protein